MLYVSFAAPFFVGGQVPAYARQFTKIDFNSLWNEKAPIL